MATPTIVNDGELSSNDISVYAVQQVTKGELQASPVFEEYRRVSGSPVHAVSFVESAEIKPNRQGKQQIKDTPTDSAELASEVTQQTKDLFNAAIHAEETDATITNTDIAITATALTIPSFTGAVGDYVFLSGATDPLNNRSYLIKSAAGDDYTVEPAPAATEAAGASMTVASIKNTSNKLQYYYAIQERMLNLSAVDDISYSTFLDSIINTMTFEVPESGICTSTATFNIEKLLTGDAAIVGQTDGPNDDSDVVSATNNVKMVWVDGVEVPCEVKNLTLEVNNNYQQSLAAGCSGSSYSIGAFNASGSFSTKSLKSNSTKWRTLYRDGTRVNLALEILWPDDNRQMIIELEQVVITDHTMPTEPNAIAQNDMSFACEENPATNTTVRTFTNW